ncbi:MAG: DedA family protein [Alphaproteobacteria bacterium]|nr:DedA family protein [Alphaproteobacteria bacterium]HRI75642.1 YqaA family protein [Alphaproteobacteria bacterium]
MMKYIRKLYDWTLRIAAHRHAQPGLFGIAFVESSVFPLPPDLVLIPMCIAERRKAFWFATICTAGSVLGGICAYAIGYFLYDTVGVKIIDFYNLQEQFVKFRDMYNAHGAWIVLAGGFTPIPYKLITIASGVTQMDFVQFALFSIIGRASRFYLVAALLWKFGAPIKDFIEKYLGILTIIFFVVLIGGFVAIKYIS